MYYNSNHERDYNKAANIARDVNSMFPKEAYISDWIRILDRYNIYESNRDKKDAFDEFTRKAKVDLGILLNKL